MFGLKSIPAFSVRSGDSVSRIPKSGNRGQPTKAIHCLVGADYSASRAERGGEYDLSLAMREGSPCRVDDEGKLLDVPDNCYPSDSIDGYGGLVGLPDSVFSNPFLALVYRLHCQRQAILDMQQEADILESDIESYFDGSKPFHVRAPMDDGAKILRVVSKMDDKHKAAEILRQQLAKIEAEIAAE